eukprot:m.48881 g.48881  ORF g.48881 m.48881 type:complete len:2810 (-) comp12432_c0_seq1:42-8471(-)
MKRSKGPRPQASQTEPAPPPYNELPDDSFDSHELPAERDLVDRRYKLEPIEDVQARAEAMPDSAEKFATLLWLDLMARVAHSSATNTSQGALATPQPTQSHDIQDLLAKLDARLKKEAYHRIGPGAVDRLRHHISRSNWGDAFAEGTQLLQSIRPFNIHTTIYLIQQSKAYAQVMKDKSVVVFLGRSGAGKTTSILYLTGHSMIRRDNEYRDIGPRPGDAPSEFRVNGDPESETAHVFGIEVSKDDLEKFECDPVTMDELEPLSVLFVDTPGIGDSLGAEVDIANILGIHHALKACKEFRPVIVLSAWGGDNFETSKACLETVSQLFKSVRTVYQRLSYLVTKCDGDHHEGIMRKLKVLQSQVSTLPKEDPFRTIIIGAMSTIKKQNGNEIVLPLEPSRISTHLDTILEKLALTPTDIAEDAAISCESEAVIERQLSVLSDTLTYALGQNELDLVCHVARELEMLAEAVPLERIRSAVQRCHETIVSHLTGTFTRLAGRIDEFSDCNTSIISQDVLATLGGLEDSVALLHQRLPQLDLSAVSKEATAHLFSRLFHELEDGAVSRVLTLPKRANQLTKLRTLCTLFPQQQEYTRVTSALVASLNANKHQALQALSEYRLETCTELTQQVLNEVDALGAHLVSNEQGELVAVPLPTAARDGEASEEHVTSASGGTDCTHLDTWKQAFLGTLRACFTHLVSDVKQALEMKARNPSASSVFTDADTLVQQLKQSLALVEGARQTDGLPRLLTPQLLDSTERELRAAVDAYLGGVSTAVSVSCESNGMDALPTLRPFVQLINEFKSLSWVLAEVVATHQDTVRRTICALVAGAQNEVRDIVERKLFDEKGSGLDSDTVARLPMLLRALRDADWINEDLQPGIIDETLQRIERDMLGQAAVYTAIICDTPLQVNNLDNLSDIARAFKALKGFRLLQSFLPGIKEQCEEVEQHITKGFERIRHSTTSLFDRILEENERIQQGACEFDTTRTLKFTTVQRIKTFLDACRARRLNDYFVDVNELSSELESGIVAYGAYLSHVLQKYGQAISDFDEQARRNHTEAVKDLQQTAFQLQIRLAELEQLERKYPDLHYFIEEDNQPLSSAKIGLRNDAVLRDSTCCALLQSGDVLQLQIQVSAAATLRQLDAVLGDRPITYAKLFQKYSSSMQDSTDTVLQELSDALKQRNFRIVSIKWNQLEKAGKPLESVRARIISEGNVLHQQCYSESLIFVDQADTKGCFDKLHDILQLCEDCISQLSGARDLLSDADKKVWNDYRHSVQNNIVEALLYRCDWADYAIRLARFEDAKRVHKLVSHIMGRMGNLVNVDIIGKRIAELRDVLANGPAEVVSELQKMTLEQIVKRPPYIFQTLNTAPEELKSQVWAVVSEKIDEFVSKLLQHDVAEIQPHWIHPIEKLKQILPSQLHAQIDIVVEEFSGHLARQERSALDQIQAYFANEDWAAIDKLVERTTHAKTDTANRLDAKIQEHVKRVTEQALNLVSNVETSNELLQHVHKLERCAQHKYPGAQSYSNQLAQAIHVELEKKRQEIRFFIDNPSCHNDRQYEITAINLRHLLYLQTATAGQDDVLRDLLNRHRQLLELFQHDLDAIGLAVQQRKELHPLMKAAGKLQDFTHQTRLLRAMSLLIQSNTGTDLAAICENCTDIVTRSVTVIGEFEKLTEQLYQESLSTQLLADKHQVNTDETYWAYTIIQMALKLVSVAEKLQPFLHTVNETWNDSLLSHVKQQREIVQNETSSAFQQNNYALIGKLTSHCRIFDQLFPDTKQASSDASSVEEHVMSQAKKLIEELYCARGMRDLADRLMSLQDMADNIDAVKEFASRKMDDFLQWYDQRSQQAVPKLGVHLSQLPDPRALRVLQEHKCFTGYLRRLFNLKISSLTIAGVIEKLSACSLSGMTSLQATELRKAYDEFRTHYETTLQQHINAGPSALDRIAPTIRATVERVMSYSSHESGLNWTSAMESKVPCLAADIFCMWTLYHTNGNSEERDMLLQPHPAQAVAIFRLLGIGASTSGELTPSLVQVLTGQGKAVILAVTASILALFGMQVSLACYSEYLSCRDRDDFRFLFQKLEILEHVQYGTFNKLCEDVINKDGDIRELVVNLVKNDQLVKQDSAPARSFIEKTKKFIKQKAAAFMGARAVRPRVLVIDEVDVALDPSFLGNTYTASCKISTPEITDFIFYLWDNRTAITHTGQLSGVAEYTSLIQRFSNWTGLIQNCVNGLLNDLHSYESHDYVFQDGKIGYRQHDTVNFSMRARYKTLFALLHELERDRVDIRASESVREELCLLINCGEFSYFAVQKAFALTLGVTGTLVHLSDVELEVLRNDYNIKAMTTMPSMFGASKLVDFQPDDLQIVDASDFFLTIVQEISKRHRNDRPVIVFFDNENVMREFKNFDAFQVYLPHTHMLTEKATSAEKEKIVRLATTQRHVLLSTRSFGRGVDFQVRDPVVTERGGVHILQTFLADTMAEERQIMGRTARQGDPGSHSMVLNKLDLEKFGIEEDKLGAAESTSQLLNYLHQKRDEAFAKKFSQCRALVDTVQAEHDKSLEFLAAVFAGDKPAATTFLEKWNYSPAASLSRVMRTIYAIDCTGSMGTNLAKTIQVIGIVFDRIGEILKQQNIQDGDFAIQIVAFRNYNSPAQELLQVSGWEQNPLNLRQFLSSLQVAGGWGREAIEVALQRANKEENVSQIILIGDAPANTPQDIKRKRSDRGEAYWTKHKFGDVTDADTELNILAQNGIPVHAFYIAERAKEFFQHVATRTNGRHEFLDIEASTGADQLTNLVSEELLRRMGGDKLVDTYRATFCK